MQPPKTLNGYPLIARDQIDDETWAILAWRDTNLYHPYVVATWSIHSQVEWQHGEYLADIVTAAQCYEARRKGF